MLLPLLQNNLLGVADTTPPVLSLPTAAAFSPTAISGTVTTDEGNGTLYFYASTNSSESAATIKASGDTQAVTASGVQNVLVGFLTPETDYYLHFVQDDLATNESNVVSSAQVSTPAVVEEVQENTGGYAFWQEIDEAIERSRQAQRRRQRKRRKIKKIEDEIDQKLFKIERELEEKEAREAELDRLTRLVEENRRVIVQTSNQRLIAAANDAARKATFSAMEKLERELRKYREEEEFLLMATKIILESQ